ncbi:hypothetical protein ACO0LV_01875 [Pseudactinotalea sp. Z1739]|uniref:hypothetical protein n=1 Tax=Pseudactinotalea sp. Z1739 TaxID=3413028 RepID=UPI003C7B586A
MATVYGSSNAERVHRRYQQELARVREDADLSDGGKQRRIAKAYVTAVRELEQLRGAIKAQRTTDSAAAAQKVHSIGDLIRPGMDPGAAAVSYRDAQDRVGQITNSDEALRLLSRAERSGDYVLGRALAAHAVDMGWRHIVDAYADGHPQWGRAVQEHDSARPSFGARVHEEAYTQAPSRPVELGYLSDREAAVVAGL